MASRTSAPETSVRPGEGNLQPFATPDTEPEVADDAPLLPDEPIEADEPALKPAVATEGETEEEKTKRQSAIREAYGAAMRRLREDNLDTFNALHKEEAANRGYDWSPRPTAEQKAEAELRRLLEQHPDLASRVGEITQES